MIRATTSVLLASFGLFLMASPAPVVAATGTITIGDEGADGEVGVGLRRLIAPGSTENWFQDGHGCWTGSEAQAVGYFEYRFALEFPLDTLPDDATVTGATLALRTSRNDLAQQTAIYGYAADGTIAAADVDVTGTPVLFTPTTAQRQTWDVSSLLTGEVIAAGWAGFSFRQEPLQSDPRTLGSFDCPINALFPILTIEYSVPDPEPTPTPAPTPTATPAPTAEATPTPTGTSTDSPSAGMLPDTAVGGTGPIAWLAILALASLALMVHRGFGVTRR